MPTTAHEALSDDIHRLGDALGGAIRRLAGEDAYSLVEDVRAAAKALRADPSVDEARRLRDRLGTLGLAELRTLIRAFSVYFDLTNLAEQQARVRSIRGHLARAADAPMPETPEAALLALRDRGVDADQLAAHLDRALVVPVFTAHPSEARRRTILGRLTALAKHLDRLELGHPTPAERSRAEAAVAEEVETLWLSDTVRDARPAVLDEVRHGLGTVENTLLNVVPRVYRELEDGLTKVYPGREWDVPAFLRFGSWIGGDRDGHPDVTHTTTAEALRLQQETLLRHYISRVEDLWRALSHSDHFAPPGDAFRASLEADLALFPNAGQGHPHEPYRTKCRTIALKLERTLAYVRAQSPAWEGEERPTPKGVYLGRHDLLADFHVIADDLRRAGALAAAGGEVRDLIRLVEVFGVHLLDVDLRQHSARHAGAVAETFKAAGVCDNYLELTPDERFDRLARELLSTRPLIPARLNFSPETTEVVQTFRTASAILERHCPEAIHTYIISNTTEPAHLLEVLLLAREARLFRPEEGVSRIGIVPLFEALEPLQSATAIMRKLYDLPAYREHLRLRGDTQEVMIGYSDSNKESGFLQSAWALYRAQAELVALGQDAGVTTQFFHGRGGAVGRGGGPANRAILAQPVGTVNGRLRITEQGEMIADRYGHPGIADRHLDQVLHAVLMTSFPDDSAGPDPSWTSMLDRLAADARKHYRALVYDNPDFPTYFLQATPIEEITQFKIGSRPTRRSGSPSVEQLRAIPWVFSWMQCRHTLPGWYGLGSAVGDYLAGHPDALAELQAMYRQWPFWTTLIDNAQMILAKADMTIARLYADLVDDQELASRVFGQVEAEYRKTVDVVCRITGQSHLLERVPILEHSIQRRNPYVDPLSFIQLVLLKRLRSGEGPHDETLTAVLESINGVASGLKNTG